MKIITLNEFKNMTAGNDWQRDQTVEIMDFYDRHEWSEKNDLIDRIKIPHAWGLAHKISTLGDISITYTEVFNYDEFDPDSLNTETDDENYNTWIIEGIKVVDEDGDELSLKYLSCYLNSDFSSIDYSVLDIEQTTNIDLDEESNMRTYKIEIDHAPSIRFTGEVLASVASTDNQAASRSFSGETGMWSELNLYKTKGGKFICHQIDFTRWSGDRDRFSAKVCTSLEEVKEFFGHGWLAKELYKEAEIDDATDIE